MKYGYVLEPGRGRWFAYAPNLPGCIAAGKTAERAARNIAGAAQVYVEYLRETGEPVPPPSRRIEAYPETEPGYRVVQPGEAPAEFQSGKLRGWRTLRRMKRLAKGRPHTTYYGKGDGWRYGGPETPLWAEELSPATRPLVDPSRRNRGKRFGRDR